MNEVILHDSAKIQKVSREVGSGLSRGMGTFMAFLDMKLHHIPHSGKIR